MPRLPPSPATPPVPGWSAMAACSPGTAALARLAIFLEWNLAVMFPQKIQKPLVFPRLHVEQPRDDLVVAPGFFETAADHLPDVAARNLAVHKQRIDRRPERLALFDQPLVQIVGDCPAALSLGAKRHRIPHADL